MVNEECSIKATKIAKRSGMMVSQIPDFALHLNSDDCCARERSRSRCSFVAGRFDRRPRFPRPFRPRLCGNKSSIFVEGDGERERKEKKMQNKFKWLE